MALANTAFEAQRAAQVEGRKAELARIAAYLASAHSADIRSPLVVTGAAGSGKSTVLAEAAKRAAVAYPGAALLTRYCGVTPGTGSLSELLTDLRQAIARAYGQPEPAALPNLEELVAAFSVEQATLVAPPKRPLLLIVDAIDQLSAQPQRTDWLPPRLAPGVCVVVSVLAERRELAILCDRLPAEQVLTLAPLGLDAGRAILRHLLDVAPRRTLSGEQEDAVLVAFAVQGLPLYLRLAASEACRWRSFDPPQLGMAPLPETTEGLLEARLARLEAPGRHGQALVAHALGDLAAASFGLAEDELLDLLARDPTVRATLHELSPHSPPIDEQLPLPVALWARLHAEVEALLTEREMDGVRLASFYHQQLRAAVEARYLAGSAADAYHQALVGYFAEQPWQLGPRTWNWRKIRELLLQQEATGDRAGAEQTLSALVGTLQQAASDMDDHEGITTVDSIIAAVQDRIITGGYWRLGMDMFTLQLAIAREVGDRAMEGTTLNNLGALANNLGRTEEAARYYEQALVIHEEIGAVDKARVVRENLAELRGDSV
ncbi:MAG TPA: AAA family ATPase [Ktedonobacterales bacterium]|nr:AAA family ATPase [Ktedonobacterales bacterium]